MMDKVQRNDMTATVSTYNIPCVRMAFVVASLAETSVASHALRDHVTSIHHDAFSTAATRTRCLNPFVLRLRCPSIPLFLSYKVLLSPHLNSCCRRSPTRRGPTSQARAASKAVIPRQTRCAWHLARRALVRDHIFPEYASYYI